MALVFNRNRVGVENTSTTVGVPEHPVARLMYYLNCMSTVLSLDQPFINCLSNYTNFASLSADEIVFLVAFCAKLDPIKLTGLCLIHDENVRSTAGRDNEFYNINAESTTFAAVESVIVGEKRVAVKKQTYKATSEEAPDISTTLRVVLIVLTSFPVLVNVFYIIVCFSALKKKFHNLLVLSLCIGDSILSLSVTVFSVIKLPGVSDTLGTNVHLCLVSTFLVVYGLTYSYGMVFLICLERYVVVNHFNFCKETIFFERFKYVIIFGFCALALLFNIEIFLSVPYKMSIEKCTNHDLYGERIQTFIVMVGTIIMILMCGIIFLSIGTSKLIWKYYFKGAKIVPKPAGKDECAPAENRHLNHERSLSMPSRTTQAQDQEEPGSSGQTIEREIEMSIRIKKIVDIWKKERYAGETQLPITLQPSPKQTKLFQNRTLGSWEKRAFGTSILIAVTTLLLTGPFVLSYWLDFFYESRQVSRKIRLILCAPLVANSLINPFLYAWRIPEIKKAIKKIFCSSC